MIKSKNIEVESFLNGLMLMDSEQYRLLVEMREIVFNIYPKTKEKIMYEGIVFFLNTKMFSGLFINKSHITLEFSEGYIMEDSNKYLEGIGKFRRHLKIRTHTDIKNKEVALYVKQAVK